VKAVGLFRSAPIDDPDSLVEVDVAQPSPGPADLLVRVRAASVNPVDAKQRQRAAPTPRDQPLILGYDACGEVEAVGRDVTGFRPGDRVYYAGDINRPGSNAEFQAVDHRIAARAPASLTPQEAAALPLTALTAWEGLFDRLALDKTGPGRTILVIGGAGGVGSIAVQILRAVTDFRVIGTASRPESADFTSAMGAHQVVDHRALAAGLKEIGIEAVDAVFTTADINAHWEAMCRLVAPGGAIGAIVGGKMPVDLNLLQKKSVRFAWEFMFMRPAERRPDMALQGRWLAEIAALVEAGKIRSTMTDCLDGLSAKTVREAHRRIESGTTIGKIAMRFGSSG
jgi:NADPH:quinone reductase